MQPRRAPITAAFTLVELLVVIGIIALLISILLPSLNVARQQALSVKCLSNMRQLGTAFAMYANDNKGWMPSCDTCGPLAPQNFYDSTETAQWPSVSATQTWVGWVDAGATEASIENGTLWKYIKNNKLYKCPSDFNDYRNRTYSLNNVICEGGFNAGGTGWANINQWKIYKITQAGDTARTISFVEEMDTRGTAGASPSNLAGQWNVNGWYQNPAGANLPSNWIDTVVSWHRNGANFTFMDGHAEHWRWSDPRTINYLKNDPTWPSPLYVTANNKDLARIQAGVCTWPQQRSY